MNAMSEKTRLGLEILGAATVLGVSGDPLLRATPWGLNALLCTAGLVAAAAYIVHRHGIAVSADALWLAVAILLLASNFTARDSMALRALDSIGLAILCCLACLSLRGVAIRGLHAWEYVQAGLAAAGGAWVGAFARGGRGARWGGGPRGGGPRPPPRGRDRPDPTHHGPDLRRVRASGVLRAGRRERPRAAYPARGGLGRSQRGASAAPHLPVSRRIADPAARGGDGLRARADAPLCGPVRAVGGTAVRHRLHGVRRRHRRVVRLDRAARAAAALRLRRTGAGVRCARRAARPQSRRLHRAHQPRPAAPRPTVRRQVRGLPERRRGARPPRGRPAAGRCGAVSAERTAPRTLGARGRRLAELEPRAPPGAPGRAGTRSGPPGSRLQGVTSVIRFFHGKTWRITKRGCSSRRWPWGSASTS